MTHIASKNGKIEKLLPSPYAPIAIFEITVADVIIEGQRRFLDMA